VRKTHIVVLIVVALAAVFAFGAAGAYGDLASDTNAPTTTTDAVASYWDDAVITVTATDDEGIAYIYHELDEGIAHLSTVEGSPTSASISAPLKFHSTEHKNPGVGTHTLKYWAQDINGNVEAQQTVTFEIVADGVGPVTSAQAVSVRRGRIATLKYMVSDAEPTKGAATVAFRIKNLRGRTVKIINAGVQDVNTALTAKFRCTLRKGVYRYTVFATDEAGNKQSRSGSAKLTVK
jgi:hypothetical protein